MLTKEQRFADFVYEMNDWLCGLQYQQIDPRHPLWIGGFMEWTDGKAVSAAPSVLSACYAEGLAEAYRLSKETGDLARQQRYRETLERSLQFLTTLQYTEGNTQHFADWYRPALLEPSTPPIRTATFASITPARAVRAGAIHAVCVGW